MNIPEHFPQFEESRTLIIVSGTQHGRVFVASEGVVEELFDIKEEDPKYADREGHFKHRGGGETYESGSVYESKDNIAERYYLNKLSDNLNHLERDDALDDIIVCAPKHFQSTLLHALPSGLKKLVTTVVDGNYSNTHPLEILERIYDSSKE